MTHHVDPEIFALIEEEKEKQSNTINLIASENIVSKDVLEATGSILTNKYAEGYPEKRYYGGCPKVDSIEKIAIERACKLFGAEHANVQPHSGSQANMGAYCACIKPGAKILAMDISSGGHLTHGTSVNFSGTFFKPIFYGLVEETGLIDYEQVRDLARREKPDIIVCGASSYSRIIDFAQMSSIAKESGTYLLADIAHIAGLVITGLHPSPIGHADFVTSTTHKTLRGPRGGMILCGKRYGKAVDNAVFPGIQGGPLMNTIAAKAVAFKEAMGENFAVYQRQIIKNSKHLCKELKKRGHGVVSGGTDNHLIVLDLRRKSITGADFQALLESVGIICNKNLIPFDPLPPQMTSGVRLGTPAITSRGMREDDIGQIALFIDETLKNRDKPAFIKDMADKIRRFANGFPIYPTA